MTQSFITVADAYKKKRCKSKNAVFQNNDLRQMVHYFSPLPRLDAIFKYIGPNMYKLKVTKPEVERVYRF